MLSTAERLPRPTHDRERAAEDLRVFGYCIVKDALSAGEVAALRAKVVAQALGEVAAGVAWQESQANQRIWMLINKGRAYRELVTHPLAIEMMTRLLGEGFLLSSLTANIARPGGEPMFLHTDQGYVEFQSPEPLVANIIWMLDDFTEANGGTRLMPGSHRFENWRQELKRPTIAAEGPAGAALIFDGRLIHGTGANRTADQERHAILTYYCRPYVRQQENYFLGMAPDLLDACDETLLRHLGFSIWRGLGRTDSPVQDGLLAPALHPTRGLLADGSDAGG